MENLNMKGTTEYNILHIPFNARSAFIEIIQQSHPIESVEFWETAWEERDQEARKLIGEDREGFIKECCSRLSDVIYWRTVWKNTDAEKELLCVR